MFDDDVIDSDDVEVEENEDESAMSGSEKRQKEKDKLDTRRRLEEYLEARRIDKELFEY